MPNDSGGGGQRIAGVIQTVIGSKFWRNAALVAVAVAGLYWFFAWRAQVQDVELALLRQANEQQQAALAKAVAGLESQNKALASANGGLQQANAQLGVKIGQLTVESRRLTELANRRVEAIATLPLAAVGRDIAKLIEVPESEIAQGVGESLTLTDRAARADLRELVVGQTARQQLDLAAQEAAALRAQNANLDEANKNLGQMVKNERERGEAITTAVTLRMREAQKETAVVKAQARKRHMVYGLVGFVAGAVVVAVR